MIITADLTKNLKVMTEEQVKEIDALLIGEHGTAIAAFGFECMVSGYESLRKSAFIGIAAGVAVGLINVVYYNLHKKRLEVKDEDVGRY